MVVISDFNGLVAVITGASGGMGKEMALQLCQMGCSVAICDIREDVLLETAQECEKAKKNSNVKVFAQACDVTSEEDVLKFKDSVLEFFNGKVNILINNAGMSIGGSFLTMSEKAFDRCFDVSFKGVLLFCRAFLPTIVEQKTGYVLNCSSINAFWCCLGPAKFPIGTAAHTPYAAAKSAIKGFTEALLHDSYQNFPHIGVACIHPGHIGTDIGKQDYASMPADEVQRYRDILNLLPQYRGKANQMSVEELGDVLSHHFKKAGLSAHDAAEEILNGMKTGSTRILVGEDARINDIVSRMFPRLIYNDYFMVTVLLPAMQMATAVGRPFGLPIGRFAYPTVLSAAGYGLWSFLNKGSKL